MREVKAHPYWSLENRGIINYVTPVIASKERFDNFIKTQENTSNYEYVCEFGQLKGLHFEKAIIIGPLTQKFEDIADFITEGPR